MERSHYQAKGAYFKSTRHGGGVTKSNALHEMFNWFYRTLGGRKSARHRGNITLRRRVVQIVSAARARAYQESGARDGIIRWMSNRCRSGSRWVPMS